jgi:hypothetical protein
MGEHIRFKISSKPGTWGHNPIISEFRRVRQKGGEFKEAWVT